jgi:gluconate 2-dehydrogenase subunit 3-like protein
MEDLSRRDLLKLGAAATLTASLGVRESLAQAPAQAAPVFLTPQEFSLVDELSEMIIPTDEHSPGARAAKVAAYIDSRLPDWEDRDGFREGLKLVDQLSQQVHAKTFMQASPDERAAVLARMAQNEGKPQKPEEVFFAELKAKVVQAYYTSEIGIKQEMEYKGNGYLAEFAGTDVS